jgi:uncharacterized protein (TIGR02444 family)
VSPSDAGGVAALARDFWSFSVTTYGRPGVATACLALQDECGADVNLLMYCCWLGLRGCVLERNGLQGALDAIGRWQAEVVQPLRRARLAIAKAPHGCVDATPAGTLGADAVRGRATAVRRRIAAVELAAEQVEQHALAAHAARLPATFGERAPDAAIAENLAHYVARLALPARSPAAHLSVLARACPPTIVDDVEAHRPGGESAPKREARRGVQ